MKKGILKTISAALTVFMLTAGVLIIQTITALQSKPANTGNSIIEGANGVPGTQSQATLPGQIQKNNIDEPTAISIAQNQSGLAVLASVKPDLVDLNGRTAYEVVFDAGKMYVDANSGIILADNIQISPETAGQAAANFLQLSRFAKVELVSRNGQNLYLVFFQEGIYVYVNFKGQIIGWEYAQPAPANPAANANTNPSRSEKEDD
jgi:hypothetical protein